MLSKFGSMMSMMKGGDPSALLGQMAGRDSGMSRAIAEAHQLQNQHGNNLEQYVRSEFQKSGLDIQEVRRTLGI